MSRSALEAIRRLYYETTRQTITRDLRQAVALLTSMDSDEARERAAVYMDGLAQMRAEWARSPGRGAPRGAKRHGVKGRGPRDRDRKR